MGYPKSVIRRAEQILGYGITETPGERVYPVIDGVVYTDLFQGDVEAIVGYTGTIRKSFNGRSNGVEYYNQIDLVARCHLKEVTLDLDWGSECFNKEIDGLLEWLSENSAADNLDEAGVKSKKIEDFSVTKGTAEEKSNDISIILNEGFGFYIRRPLLIDVAREQKDGSRYF